MHLRQLILAVSLLFSFSAFAQNSDFRVIEYKDKDTTYEGFFMTPQTRKKEVQGILMIHNWKGVTDETKKQAERFAKLGYPVFAADVYGKGIRPTDPKAAGAEAGKYKNNRALFRERLNLALKELNKLGIKQVAVVGYCFGGTGALELARSGADVQAVVSFHGGLDSPTPKDGAKIKGHVLALHGANDPNVPPADVAAFEDEMKTNKVDYQLIKYGGAVHSFTEMSAGNDPSKGAAYDERADRRSFAATEDFLNEFFNRAKK